MTRRRPEQDLQRSVVAHLRARGRPHCVWWHHPAGGLRSKIEARIMAGLGTVAGIPDVLALRRGTPYRIELKCPCGRLSERQAEMIDCLRKAGAYVAACDDLDRALACLEQWGLLQGRTQ